MKKIVLTLLLIIGINSFSNYDFGNFLVSALVSEGNLKVYDLECVSMKKKDFGKWFPLSWTRDYFPEAKYNSVYGSLICTNNQKITKTVLITDQKLIQEILDGTVWKEHIDKGDDMRYVFKTRGLISNDLAIIGDDIISDVMSPNLDFEEFSQEMLKIIRAYQQFITEAWNRGETNEMYAR